MLRALLFFLIALSVAVICGVSVWSPASDSDAQIGDDDNVRHPRRNPNVTLTTVAVDRRFPPSLAEPYRYRIPGLAPSTDPVFESPDVVEALERARLDAEYRRRTEARDYAQAQARRAAEAELRATALERSAAWEKQEALLTAENKARLAAEAQARAESWEIEEAENRRRNQVRYQTNLAEYVMTWDLAEQRSEAEERAVAASSQRLVALAHASLQSRYQGDGRETIRDARRARADAWAAAEREVRSRKIAEAFAQSRTTAESQFVSVSLARIEAETESRTATWRRQETARQMEAQAELLADAQARRAEWERSQTAWLAAAQAEVENGLFRRADAWTDSRTVGDRNSETEPSRDRTTRHDSSPWLPGGAVVSLLSVVGILYRKGFAVSG